MAISHLCEHNDEYSVVAGCDAFDNSEMVSGYLSPADCTEDFDVIVDFSNAMYVSDNSQLCGNCKPFICCTTGLFRRDGIRDS